MSDLDREVAEALGYIKVKGDNDMYHEPGTKIINGRYEKMPLWFHPSTNGAQAWELAKRFNVWPIKYVTMYFIFGKDRLGMFNTPEEAVCRAVIALCKERENARD